MVNLLFSSSNTQNIFSSPKTCHMHGKQKRNFVIKMFSGSHNYSGTIKKEAKMFADISSLPPLNDEC